MLPFLCPYRRIRREQKTKGGRTFSLGGVVLKMAEEEPVLTTLHGGSLGCGCELKGYTRVRSTIII
jgi:hypothetical protein